MITAASKRIDARTFTIDAVVVGPDNLWPELELQAKDLIVDKTRFGAFVPGSSNLHDILQARGSTR